MLDMSKCAAAQLDIPWHVAVAEAPRSRYEGKKLPLAKNVSKQPLLVFPELLEELFRFWADCPYGGRNKIPGASALEQWEAIVESPWVIRMIRVGHTM